MLAAPIALAQVTVALGAIPSGTGYHAVKAIPIPTGYAPVAIARWTNSTWEVAITMMHIKDGSQLEVSAINAHKAALNCTIVAQVLCVRKELCAGL